MEYMTPNFTKDMVKTHKILIPNMAVTQFRLMQAALASEGYQTEVLGNCGSEVAQLGSSPRPAAAAVRPTTSSCCARRSSRRATAIFP